MSGPILRVHVAGAGHYRIGDEIWEQSLDEAIRFEASIIAQDASSDPLESRPEHREQLRDQMIAEMTAALTQPGDTYQAPDGARYSLAAGVGFGGWSSVLIMVPSSSPLRITSPCRFIGVLSAMGS